MLGYFMFDAYKKYFDATENESEQIRIKLGMFEQLLSDWGFEVPGMSFLQENTILIAEIFAVVECVGAIMFYMGK